MPNAASYTVPDNPADPEAAALDLIERLPADILHTGAFTEVLQDYCSVPHADGAFAGLEWADTRQIAAAVSWDVISHRISAAQAVECTNDGLGCTIIHDVFNNDDEYVAPMETLPCPITIAWAEKDTLLPVEPYGNIARERLPRATFTILPDVGHVPMFDDPKLVARTILAVTGAAKK